MSRAADGRRLRGRYDALVRLFPDLRRRELAEPVKVVYYRVHQFVPPLLKIDTAT